MSYLVMNNWVWGWLIEFDKCGEIKLDILYGMNSKYWTINDSNEFRKSGVDNEMKQCIFPRYIIFTAQLHPVFWTLSRTKYTIDFNMTQNCNGFSFIGKLRFSLGSLSLYVRRIFFELQISLYLLPKIQKWHLLNLMTHQYK